MSRAESEKPTEGKRMSKDAFFSTPIYYADLADSDTLNEKLRKDIRAWRQQDPEGTVRSNVAQAGAWHSATDMHTRREFHPLTREIFEMIQGIYDELGYDSFNFYQLRCGSDYRNPHRKEVVVGDLGPRS
jgi:hypothetical protein